jgi:putative transcriptional regulator
MDDQRLGSALRAIRIRRGWRQRDLARKAKVSRTIVGRVEHGRLDNVSLGPIRRIATALDARFDTNLRWQGGDLGRLINARHAGMHEAMARMFEDLDSWTAEPEVSYSVFGERGVIDVLAWHQAKRMLLVIELKTELVEINALMGRLDQKRRLAASVAFDRRWDPAGIATWVVLAEGRTNRRTVATHQSVLRAKFPADGRTMRGWLSRPDHPVDALSFLPSVQQVRLGRDLGPVRRVSGARRVRRQACDRRAPTFSGGISASNPRDQLAEGLRRGQMAEMWHVGPARPWVRPPAARPVRQPADSLPGPAC